jgi:hypothetical protein
MFPSVAWFETLVARMRAEEAAYRELGAMDGAMVVKVDDEGEPSTLIEIVFEAFGVRSVRALTSLTEATPSHFVLEASLPVWREMIDNIHTHGGADLTHTLNYLTFPDDPMLVSGPDQLEIDKFYRYAQSVQRFFNGAARSAGATAETRAEA